ncbi:MAG: hypothetical protein U0P81_03205 [Holophagaceae bacterium]
MSDLRVALVAEGPTDEIIIQAALKALLPRPFVLTLLQPEPKRPKLGTGWGGVLRWCLDFATRGRAQFEDDPTLQGFDLFVLHVDADVAEKRYADVSAEIAALAETRGWPTLPNMIQCPPASGSAEAMRSCLLAWAGMMAPGPRTVLCVPSKSVEAWLVAAAFDNGHQLLIGLECNLNVESQLRALPVAQRIRKTSRDYRARERTIVEAWSAVRRRCAQAERFSAEVVAVVTV